MSRLEDLPPDLRAVLSLLLRQRKGYDEVAALLQIQQRAVRDRAQAGLAMLAPRQARELNAEQRVRIGDYLLGQLSAPDQERTRTELASNDAARTWAEAISLELSPLAASPLPGIPRPARQTTPTSRLPSSQRGGALLLGGIAVIVIVAVVLIIGSGGGSSSHGKSTADTSTTGTTSPSTTSTASSGTATTTATSGTATPKEEAETTLTAPDASSKAKASVLVLSEAGKRAFYLQVTGLAAAPSGAVYAVWLTGTGIKAQAVGVLPAANSSGHIEGGALLPTNASSYHRIIVTRETNQKATTPGTIVLAGPLKLSSGH
jgi:hypothetical protein